MKSHEAFSACGLHRHLIARPKTAASTEGPIDSMHTRTEMYSRLADKSPRSPLSPRSVDLVPSPTEAVPDPNEIANLLRIKGHHTPTYDAISRESTPCVVADAKQWIHRIEALQESITCLSATFVHEEWRQKNIFDSRYWEIEADFWESYYHDSFINEKRQRGQNLQEEDLLKNQQAQHDLYFFQHTSQFDWLSTYTQFTSKTSTIPQHEIHRLVFDTIYHRHRARHWQGLCEKRDRVLLFQSRDYEIGERIS
ncbi:hypothetical protein BDZ45DRAFT_220690 [Acephala macrosclerotiorum]|nr:hypothetical protein BDZ45DRAFT_220690 [Acephala macrosclerotiorum]